MLKEKKKNFFHSLIRMKNYRNLYFNRHNNFHKVFFLFLFHSCLLILYAFFSLYTISSGTSKKRRQKKSSNLKQERKLICLWNDKSSVKYHMGPNKAISVGGMWDKSKRGWEAKKVLKNGPN